MIIDGDFITQGDTMLNELNARFRDIRQGPDGYIFVLTESRVRGPNDTNGMLLRLEPPSAATAMASAEGMVVPRTWVRWNGEQISRTTDQEADKNESKGSVL